MFIITDSEKPKLKNFFNAINEMIEGRFILSDIKVSNVLKSIASSDILYDLFAKCLINFDFTLEFKKAKVSQKTDGGYFIVPKQEDKLIALVFCFLLEVDNQKINLQSFINENFYNADGYNISYNNFANAVLIPFKETIKELMGIDENGEIIKDANSEIFERDQINSIDEENDHDHRVKIMLANLVMSLNELRNAISKDSKIKSEQKEELFLTLKAFNEAIKIENFVIINALTITLELMLNKNKFIRPYYIEVKECLINFYSALQE